jgi:hypothetical protein
MSLKNIIKISYIKYFLARFLMHLILKRYNEC